MLSEKIRNWARMCPERDWFYRDLIFNLPDGRDHYRNPRWVNQRRTITQHRYILYGLYHAGLMISFDFLDRKNKTRKFWGKGPMWDLLAILVTLHFVMFGFLVFSGRLG
ncbi:MAG: hypothetical protein APF81_00780 [Desulfosporosinus sp. BRH_c37]|nr:MAG: hypothetical protein APF81_00780 [Desulfosporosinus sp. BRH_c37]